MITLFVILTAISDPPYYAATKVGDQLEYRANGKITHTTVITKVEHVKGGLLVTQKLGRELYVSAEAIVVTTMDPPITIFRPKAKTGDRWEWKGKTNLKFSYTMGGTEVVEVPAGKFNAVRVEWTDNNGNSSTLWYASNVGEVKRVVNAGTGKGEIRVLHSFTSGKK